MCAKVINAVLILQMLSCSIFGCCWHHAHAAGHSTCCHTTVAQTEPPAHHHADDKCCHQHGPAESADAKKAGEGAHCPAPKPCDEARCLFVKVLSSSDSAEDLFKLMAFQAIEFSPFVEFVTSEPIVVRHDRPVALRCPSPVERCALLQAWLI